MATTRQRGALGEAFACARLLEDGYRILERNWRSGKSEIDLITQKGNVIAFIEVKTRAQDGWCTPSQALARSQQRRIILAAVAYLRGKGIYNTGMFQPRFDLFEVVTACAGSPEVVRYRHLTSAYDTEGFDVFI